MARTEIPIMEIALATGRNLTGGTSLDKVNGHFVDTGGRTDNLVFVVQGSDAIDLILTVKAGTADVAFRSGLGDLAIGLDDGVEKMVGPFESARFIQPGGQLWFDINGTDDLLGTIFALRLPGV